MTKEHVIKLKLKSALTSKVNITILQEWIQRYNKITHDLYTFLYIVVHYCVQNNKQIPDLDHNTLNKILNYCSNEKPQNESKKRKHSDSEEKAPKKRRGPKPKQKESEETEHKAQLKREKESKNRDYAETIFEEIVQTGLWKSKEQLYSRQFIRVALNNYALKELETVFQNNIWMHFEERYLNYLDLFLVNKCSDEKRYKYAKLKLFREIIRRYEKKVARTEYVSEFKIELEPFITERLEEFPPLQNSPCLLYHLKASPISFLPMLVKMNQKMEKKFAVMPLCQKFIPRSMTINTDTLRCLLKQCNPNESFYTLSKEDLWSLAFNYAKFEPKNSELKSNRAKFSFLVQTDGFSVNLHMKPEKEEENEEKGKKQVKKISIYSKGQYELEDFRNCFSKADNSIHARFVGIDPGYHNLVSCWSPQKNLTTKHKQKRYSRYKKRLIKRMQNEVLKPNKVKIIKKPTTENIYRYTAKQRKHEMKTKVFQKIREGMLSSAEDINEIQQKLSKFNTKTSDLTEFCRYLTYLWSVEGKLYDYYADSIFRNLNFQSFQLKKISEAKFIRSMKRNYGDDAILLMGDWSETGRKALRGLSPMPNIGFRRLLAKHFLLLNTSEYNTSKTCHHCMSVGLKPYRTHCVEQACKDARYEKRKAKVSLARQRKNFRRRSVHSPNETFIPRSYIPAQVSDGHKHKPKDIRSLLKCHNTSEGEFRCGKLVNRDLNSSKLIYRQGFHYLHNGVYLLQPST